MQEYEKKKLAGWTLHIHRELLQEQERATTQAMHLLKGQLDYINRHVPEPARRHLHTVSLWMSPTYSESVPRAEYHPGADWLRENGRNPEMERGVEFTNIPIFPVECRRMPMMALHELAHAYHHQLLGYDNADILAAYRRAVASKTYDAVRRHNGNIERAYAMTNPQEYFAENSEAFFGRNDFYPFTRAELRKHDTSMERLLERLWKSGR